MKRLIFSITILGAVIAFSGCKKDFLDINQNPNSASYSTPQLTMPVALENAARIANTSYVGLGFWVGYYATSSGFSKPVETYTYDITSSFEAGVWDALYDNLEDINYVEQKAKEQKLPVYEAIAKVMKAYDYHQLVDLWGKVPYTEALKGAGNLSPKYDDGQAIYEDLVKKIDTAVALFKQPATALSIAASTDATKILLFGSLITSTDIPTFLNQWVKFSNSLKLKLLVQQSQMPGRDAYIKQNLLGLTSADFLGLGDDALVNPGYTTATAQLNPLYANFYKSYQSPGDGYNSTVASAYAATSYLGTNDPRISYFYTKDPGAATYLGSVFGDPSGTPKSAKLGAPLLNATGPSVIMTAAESLFLQAEAAYRGYITADPQTLYQNAVLASFQYTGHAADYAAYMAQANPDIQWALATDKIKLIITQKWFAMNNINILSAYNDFRRTGFPNAPLSTDANSKGKVPVRMFYPTRESQLNTANVLAAGNVDVFTTTVFWDK